MFRATIPFLFLHAQKSLKMKQDRTADGARMLPRHDLPGISGPRQSTGTMSHDDQQILITADPDTPHLLTKDALKKHDIITGTCELRQFACYDCDHVWWRTVSKTKMVSRCCRKECGKRYDALSREEEFGIGRFKCQNCGHVFVSKCTATSTCPCYECKAEVSKPYIHPKFKMDPRPPAETSCLATPTPGCAQSKPTRGGWSASDLQSRITGPMRSWGGGPWYPPQTEYKASPWSGYETNPQTWYEGNSSRSEYAASSSQSRYHTNSPRPRHETKPPEPHTSQTKRKHFCDECKGKGNCPNFRKVVNPSKEHDSTGSTLSTYLSQLSFGSDDATEFEFGPNGMPVLGEPSEDREE